MKLPKTVAKAFYATSKPKAKKGAKDKDAAAQSPAARAITASPAGEPSYCDYIAEQANIYQHWKCDGKANTMTPVGNAGDCPCSGSSGSGSGGSTASSGVDLIVLIDGSGSMDAAAQTIERVAPRAFEVAKDRCGADATVTYLYCDGDDRGTQSGVLNIRGWTSSLFLKSHEQHLITNASASGPFASDGDRLLGSEQGGKAIKDLCELNNWTPGNCRAILYVSDEYLDSVYARTVAASRAAADMAIAAANAAGVTLFTHFIGPNRLPNRADIASHYQDMADQTGGAAQTDLSAAPVAEETYIDLISQAICEGCGNSAPSCTTAALPELEPCVSITWGDSACDSMEGDDHEEICISICNCYDNVTFKNVRIGGIVITDENGRTPPRLPDGSPSSELYSVGPYCFGDIGPCVDGETSCVTRNAVIINRGLPPGTWKVRMIGLCFDVVHHYDEQELEFSFDVCKN
ncbi:hypothetical protein [Fretibacter rubidus]|uniref:hypothetical protein n=1 Tax=Fretibacter rubidus TaxID=570162 RepID=UPI00352AB4F0